jgi:hypothetical protein
VTNVQQVPASGGATGPAYAFWSYATEGLEPYTSSAQFESIVPIMADFDSVIIVTTSTDWEPVFNAGLGAMTLSETVVTSPRFAPQIQVCSDALS